LLDASLDYNLTMKNIIPVTDLQRQAASILSTLDDSAEPVVITQRGRASAVLISARRYAEIEKDLQTLDDLELSNLIEEGLRDKAAGNTLSLDEAKERLNYPG